MTLSFFPNSLLFLIIAQHKFAAPVVIVSSLRDSSADIYMRENNWQNKFYISDTSFKIWQELSLVALGNLIYFGDSRCGKVWGKFPKVRRTD